MLEGLYVHLAQKRSMYAIDPGQRLRLLRRRIGQLSDAEFHTQLARIFTELRDLHTLYVLPRPWRAAGSRRSASWSSATSRAASSAS